MNVKTKADERYIEIRKNRIIDACVDIQDRGYGNEIIEEILNRINSFHVYYSK